MLCANSECNKEFTPNRKQKYCTAECRIKCWTKANRDHLNDTVRDYRKRRYKAEGHWRDEGPKAKALKDWMLQLKSEPCQDCKKCLPSCCMDFDHRDGSTKLYDVGTMFAHHYSRELIEAELAKCDLVCANCHRIRTRDRRLGNGIT